MMWLIWYMIYGFLLFLVWEKVIKIYYKWWYYTSQGVASLGFPLPLIGNALVFHKYTQNNEGDQKENDFAVFFKNFFGTKLPKMVALIMNSEGLIMINDPVAVNDLYVTKN